MNDPGGDVQRVQAFVLATRKASTIEELRDLLEDVLDELKIDFFMFASHVDYGHPPMGAVGIGNYPREWVARARERGDWRIDPVLSACERTSAGFIWDELPDLISISPQQAAYMQAGQRFGLGDGFSVPNHVPGELPGSCHFAVLPGFHIAERNLPMLQSIATFGYERSRQLSAGVERPLILHAPLTDRQRDCLLLAAKGKSDQIIAQLLGLRPRTVNEHMESAKRRYCVATRQQLIVRALYASQITFSEVLQ